MTGTERRGSGENQSELISWLPAAGAGWQVARGKGATKGEGKALVTDCAPLCARAMRTLPPSVLTRPRGQRLNHLYLTDVLQRRVQ